MGIISKILALTHPEFPQCNPHLVIEKEDQLKLSQGKVLLLKDSKYEAQWFVRIPSEKMGKEVSKEDIIIEETSGFNLNPVRQAELNSFFKKYPNKKAAFYS